MFASQPLQGDKASQYEQLQAQARALLAGEHDRIANAANLSSLVFNALPDLNWVGFYFFDGTELVVGPFQGQPACVRIPLNRGVCGAAPRPRPPHPGAPGDAPRRAPGPPRGLPPGLLNSLCSRPARLRQAQCLPWWELEPESANSFSASR